MAFEEKSEDHQINYYIFWEPWMSGTNWHCLKVLRNRSQLHALLLYFKYTSVIQNTIVADVWFPFWFCANKQISSAMKGMTRMKKRIAQKHHPGLTFLLLQCTFLFFQTIHYVSPHEPALMVYYFQAHMLIRPHLLCIENDLPSISVCHGVI